MMFVEVHAPKGTLRAEQRQRIGEGISGALTGDGMGEVAPAEVLDRARSLLNVVFCEHDWIAGGRRMDDGAQRFLVRVSVPEGWREEGLGGHVIEACTRVFAEVAGDRVYDLPEVLVHVVGVPDGSCGLFGKVLTSNDVTRYITEPNRNRPAPVDLPSGTGYDPVCGMTVPFEHAAATADHDGTRYAFCSKGCHEVFAEDHAAA